MIDTDKYEGHTEGEWEWWNDYIRDTSENELHIAKMEYDYKSADAHLIADAPLLLEELKRLREEVKELNEVIDLMTQDIEGWQAMKPNQLRECLWWCYDLARFGKEIEIEDWDFIGRLLGADTDHNDNEWRNEE